MIKKILRLLVPPIFSLSKLQRIFHIIFYNSKIKNIITFENNFYTRQAFINKAISLKKNCHYLEIGVEKNKVFNTIPLKMTNKYGVDPIRGGNYRMASDQFFKKNSHLKFDVIFIDGLHEYHQCQRDCLNSMNALNENGIIFLHDMIPQSYFEEQPPTIWQNTSTGDVWKIAVELLNSKNVDFKIINIDCGISVLKLKQNFEYKKMPELEKMNFDNFLNFYKKFKLISCEEALDFIT